MHLSRPVEPITSDDDTIRAALAEADIPPLLVALAHLTNDMSLLRDDLRADPLQLLLPGAGITDEQAQAGRELAFKVLTRFRDDGSPAVVEPDDDQLRQMCSFLVGGADMEDYLPLFREELDVAERDPRAPRWHKDDLAPDRDFRVLIIGAGMSGIVAAHRLAQAGVDYVIVEKNDDVGGTWFENVYPGCRVDVPNHLYSYSFAQTDDWPHHFSTQETLLEYFRRCADEFGIRPHVRFGTEVVRATFDDERAVWSVEVEGLDGPDTIEAHALISAVGQLNQPLFPDTIEGFGSFAGPAFHSAQWDPDVDLAGKRVGVIGTGASAMQLIPRVAEVAGHLDVFQRTPAWLIATPSYHDEVGSGLQWLFRHVPSYSHWYRLWLFWRMADGMLPSTYVDPDWPNHEQSVSAMNEMVRFVLTSYLEEQFADRPDLLEHVVPSYPPTAKRVIRDNGVWASTLKRDDVSLITTGIERIVANGIVTVDGVTHELDVLIYGTGFQASRFLTPMEVTGRGGTDLHETWDGNARAYLGLTVPGFPNLFLMYGPNTNIVISGSIIYFSECETTYIVDAVRMLLESGHRAIDPKPEVHDRYNEWIDDGNRNRAWGASSVSSWYKSASGRVAQNWPFTLVEYWQQTRQIDPADYELL